MAHPVNQGRDLADHFTPAGDEVAVEIVIRVLASGAMSISGPMHDRAWLLAALDHAKDAVRGSQRPRDQILIPGKDVSL